MENRKKKISSDECKRIIRDEWGIELPSAYESLKHNNCIPCFKGGKEYFQAVWKNYPDEYHKAMEKEKEVGYTVFRDISLEELEKKFINDKQWEDMQMNLSDFIPCDCWT